MWLEEKVLKKKDIWKFKILSNTLTAVSALNLLLCVVSGNASLLRGLEKAHTNRKLISRDKQHIA